MCPRDNRRPCLHQLAALLQRVAAAIGLLGLVADDMSQCGFDQLTGKAGFVPGPIAEAGAEAVDGDVSTFIRRSTMSIAMLDNGLPRSGRENKIAGFASTICSRMANARPDNGTRCSRPAFMRAAGTVHTFCRCRFRTSAPQYFPDRAAVRMQNSRASAARPHAGALYDEGRDVLIGHRRMVASRQLDWLGQQVIQMAAPRAGFSPS